MEPRDKPHRIIRDGRRQLPEMNADLRLARVCQFSREMFDLKMLSEFRARFVADSLFARLFRRCCVFLTSGPLYGTN